MAARTTHNPHTKLCMMCDLSESTGGGGATDPERCRCIPVENQNRSVSGPFSYEKGVGVRFWWRRSPAVTHSLLHRAHPALAAPFSEPAGIERSPATRRIGVRRSTTAPCVGGTRMRLLHRENIEWLVFFPSIEHHAGRQRGCRTRWTPPPLPLLHTMDWMNDTMSSAGEVSLPLAELLLAYCCRLPGPAPQTE